MKSLTWMPTWERPFSSHSWITKARENHEKNLQTDPSILGVGTSDILIQSNQILLLSDMKWFLFMSWSLQILMCQIPQDNHVLDVPCLETILSIYPKRASKLWRRQRVDHSAGWTTGQRNRDPQSEMERFCTSLRPRPDLVTQTSNRPPMNKHCVELWV